MFFIFFVSRNGNGKKKKKVRRLVALGHHSMACNLYTQMRDCLIREIFRAISLLITSRQLLVFFHVLCKTSNTEIQLFCLWFCIIQMFLKSCSKKFCKIHKNATISHRHFLNKKRLKHRRFSTNFVKCLKEHLWATVSLMSFITV